MPSTTSPASSTDIPPFPSPQTFSFLPEIYLLISRLELLQQNNLNAINLQPTTPGGSTATNALSLQDLQGAVQPIKQQIQKARAAVQALADIDRTTDQQEDEIRRLEGRVADLQGRLGELGRLAKEEIVKTKDVTMTNAEE